MHVNSTLFAVVDAVAAEHRIAPGLDLDARHRVAEDLIVLQRAEAAVVDMNSNLLAVVNAVAAEYRIAARLDRNARKALPKISLSSSVPRPLS
jgi:hypothetical protein